MQCYSLMPRHPIILCYSLHLVCYSLHHGVLQFTPWCATAYMRGRPVQVRGISKKGKEFFRFNTQVTETIKRVDIHDKDIWTAGEYVHNHYIEGKDQSFFLCPDRINAAEVGGSWGHGSWAGQALAEVGGSWVMGCIQGWAGHACYLGQRYQALYDYYNYSDHYTLECQAL